MSALTPCPTRPLRRRTILFCASRRRRSAVPICTFTAERSPARTMVIFSAMNLWGKWWTPARTSPRFVKAIGWLSRLSLPAETASFVACSNMPPAKAPIAARGRRSIAKVFRHPRRCLAIVICTAGSPAARRNMCGFPKLIPARLKCRTPYPMKRCCFCRIFCPPPGRR